MPHKTDTLYPGKLIEVKNIYKSPFGEVHMIDHELLDTPMDKFKRAVAFHTKDTPKWNTSDQS